MARIRTYPIRVRCAHCGAEPGSACVGTRGLWIASIHTTRRQAAASVADLAALIEAGERSGDLQLLRRMHGALSAAMARKGA